MLEYYPGNKHDWICLFPKTMRKMWTAWKVTPKGKDSCWDHWRCERVWLLFSRVHFSSLDWEACSPGEIASCPRSTELGKRTKLNGPLECSVMLMVAEILHSAFHLCQHLGRACIWYFKYNLLDAFKVNQRFGFNFLYSLSCPFLHLWPQLL